MDVLTCVKRVPDTGARIVLTDDKQEIDASNLGFTMSPHEECAVEEAIQQVEEHGGSATALTLGSAAAEEQVRTAIAMGADAGIVLETDGKYWGPIPTAAAIADAIEEREAQDGPFDLLMFGNESADAENYQVGIRVANRLGRPVVAGVKGLEVEGSTATAERDVSGGSELYDLPLPAVVAVKEGINEPRYPSMRAKMRARKQELETREIDQEVEAGLRMIELETPVQDESSAEVLGEGPEAAPAVVEILEELEVL